jgi:hypothetical protein
MSTKIHDFANQSILGTGLAPVAATDTTSATGASVDLIAGDSRCYALQMVGVVSGTTPTLDGKIQESSDGTTWTDIAGATFTQVTASNNIQAITFDRTKRYVRYLGTVGGTTPSFTMAVFLGEQKKSV